jgi:hypothetical protein
MGCVVNECPLLFPPGQETDALEQRIAAAKAKFNVAKTLHTQHTVAREESLAHAESRKCQLHVAAMKTAFEMAHTGDVCTTVRLPHSTVYLPSDWCSLVADRATGPYANAASVLLVEDRSKAKADVAAAEDAEEAAEEDLRQKTNTKRKMLGRPPLRKRRNKQLDPPPQADKDPALRAATACGGSNERYGGSHSNERHGGSHSNWRHPELLSKEDMLRMANPTPGVAPLPSAATSAKIAHRANFLLNKDLLKVCAVCDHHEFDTALLPWHPARHRTMLVSAMPSAMQLELMAYDRYQLHEDLRKLYDVTKLVPENLQQWVKDLLLSPRGMGENGNITICNCCYERLNSGRKARFAIANGCIRPSALFPSVPSLLPPCLHVAPPHCTVPSSRPYRALSP